MITFDKKLVRILICDDDASIRDVVGLTLKEEGWSVEIVENGKLGWELLQSKPFHIVLSDIQMPEMTGMELLEAAKKMNPAIEFVIMTSNATLETALTALKNGAYDYLHKPFEDISIVPKKMTQVAEKILLRQQNSELLKRLKKASHDLKRIYDFTHHLNGVLDLDLLQKQSLAGLPVVFDTPDLRCAWFEKEEGMWKIKGQMPEGKGFDVPDSFADLEALRSRAKPQWPLTIELFPDPENADLAFAFDTPQATIANLIVGEIRTCYSKVKMHADIVSLANRDGLTRLYNHRYFQDRLSQELAQVRRQQSTLSLILMDVDNFKHFNDTNGHPAGDQLLIQLAKILQNEIGKRASDIVARYGGEEFIMALPFTNHEGALVVADRVRQSIENFHFEHREKQPLGKVSVSIGVASFPEHADQQSALIQAADKALYQAKHSGRNQVCSFKDVKSEPVAELPAEAILEEDSTSALPSEAPSETPEIAETEILSPTEVIERPTLGQVLEANEQVATSDVSPIAPNPSPANSANLPEVFDLDHLITSIDAAFFEAESKAEAVAIDAKPFGPDPVDTSVAVAPTGDEKKEGHGA